MSLARQLLVAAAADAVPKLPAGRCGVCRAGLFHKNRDACCRLSQHLWTRAAGARAAMATRLDQACSLSIAHPRSQP